MILNIIDLPRSAYRVLPPHRWQVGLALVGIAATTLMWTIL